MKNKEFLKNKLDSIDGKGYKAYKDLVGEYDFGEYVLCIDHVQGDPFASPSRVRVIVKQSVAKIPMELFNKKYKNIAVADFLTREFYANIQKCGEKVFGSGKSGLILMSKCDQQVLERTAITIDESKIESRFYVGFPARGRSVLSNELEKILFSIIPTIVNRTLIYSNINKNKLISSVKLMEDQEYIREELRKRDLVAFVANGSMLPRLSGVSTKPLLNGRKFSSPRSLEVAFDLPNNGIIKGMGIKKGITLIVGGGYHGKSTLLNALELGVYNHIGGDGREFVITDNTALKVRAEDGRCITNTDISLFINNLPNGKDTKEFYSENASGSTSQAANIIEGAESGTCLFLMDEDTSATNFMTRDSLMQRLVAKEKEPITPFINVVKPLYEQNGISTIIVVGSSGDFFGVADYVIQMDNYDVKDVTKEARELSKGCIIDNVNDIKITLTQNRKIKKGTVEEGYKGIKIKTSGLDKITINKEEIDLRAMEQIVHNEQLNSIGAIMKLAEKTLMDKNYNISDMVDKILMDINTNGLLSIDLIAGGNGSLAMPRKQEIIGAYNRYRNLKILR